MPISAGPNSPKLDFVELLRYINSEIKLQDNVQSLEHLTKPAYSECLHRYPCGINLSVIKYKLNQTHNNAWCRGCVTSRVHYLQGVFDDAASPFDLTESLGVCIVVLQFGPELLRTTDISARNGARFRS